MSDDSKPEIGKIGWTDLTVDNADASAASCAELGGKVLTGPKNFGGQGRYCVIQDPAGAVAALFTPAG